MSNDLRNKKVKQDIFTDLQLANDVKQILWQPVAIHISVVPKKQPTLVSYTEMKQVNFKIYLQEL